MGPEIPGVPFSISSDAALWVVDQLRAAGVQQPEVSRLVPAISRATTTTAAFGKAGNLRYILHDSFHIGWLGVEQAVAAAGIWIEVLDCKVFMRHDLVEALRGKHLMLRKVESTPVVLYAGFKEKGIFELPDE